MSIPLKIWVNMTKVSWQKCFEDLFIGACASHEGLNLERNCTEKGKEPPTWTLLRLCLRAIRN